MPGGCACVINRRKVTHDHRDARESPQEGEDAPRIMFAAIALGVPGIMRIFDTMWTFRCRGCSRGISKARPSAPALRSTTESISSWPPRSLCTRSSCSAGRGWTDGPGSWPARWVSRYLVDALLPNTLPDLHCPQCPRDLRARRARSQRRSCVERRRRYAPDARVQTLRNHPEVGEETPDRSNTIWLRLRTQGWSRRWSWVTFG